MARASQGAACTPDVLQKRLAYWQAQTVAELRLACKSNECAASGNKSVLACRLSLKGLPVQVPETPSAAKRKADAQVPETPSSKAAGKRKAGDAGSEAKAPKAPKTSAQPPARGGSTGLKSSKAALDLADAAGLKTADVKASLNAYVKSLAQMVDADWHDSYEETAEKASEWFEACGDIIESCLSVGVGRGVAFDRCHEALKIVADTWSNINAIPFRGDVGVVGARLHQEAAHDAARHRPPLLRPQALAHARL